MRGAENQKKKENLRVKGMAKWQKDWWEEAVLMGGPQRPLEGWVEEVSSAVYLPWSS